MGIQVQTLYKGASNDAPTSLLDRQFISFSFKPLEEENAKNIEDFNFVVVSSDDKGIAKDLYATFEDTTKSYAGINGQQWYTTKFNANALELRVGTDGVEDSELTEFLHWFRPGRIGELILSEHSNRKIKARIASAPTVEMTPFEKEVEVQIAGAKYKTSITEYKGFVTLNFVMDYPFWTATKTYYEFNELDKLSDFDKKIVYKTVYEDRVPFLNQFTDNLKIKFAGDNSFYESRDTTDSSIVGIARVNVAILGKAYDYLIKGGQSIDLKAGESFKIYYAGTAPCYPKISFTVNLNHDSFKDKNAVETDYITKINNNYTKERFSYISIGKEKLRYTLPGFLSSYNEAVKVLRSDKSGSYEKLIENIKYNVMDSYLCPIVVSLIESVRGNKTVFDQGQATQIIALLKESILGDYKFEIDCQSGICTVTFKLKIKERMVDDNYLSGNYGKISEVEIKKEIKEKCGDMLLSPCVKINQRSNLKNGFIDTDSLINVVSSVDVKEFSIDYEYMYL